MAQRPGTPRLLRELNDRAALELLISGGPRTRAQIGAHTGLSKVTAAQLLSRLEERGLVQVVGTQAGVRGPSAALYGVIPASAYVAGLDVGPRTVAVAVADITGDVVAETTVDPGEDDPVRVVHDAVSGAAASAGVPISRLRSVALGTPGVVDPRTGDLKFVFDLPHWHDGLLGALRDDLHCPVLIENDVNLAAVAEREYGAARDVDDFALIWIGRGVGLATVLGRRLHRGFSGGAGEIGYLPVPGVPLPDTVRESATWGSPALGGGFGSLVGADAIRELAAQHGIDGPTALDCVATAPDSVAGGGFLDELARRISLGVASVNIVLDPGLLVIAGGVGQAGGARLAELVEQAVGAICPTRPRVESTAVEGNPVLRGAVHLALESAREEVFASISGD